MWAYDRDMDTIPLAQSPLTLMLHCVDLGTEPRVAREHHLKKKKGTNRFLNFDPVKLKEQKKNKFVKTTSENVHIKCHG